MLSPIATVLDTYFVNQDYVAVPKWVQNISKFLRINFPIYLQAKFFAWKIGDD